MVCSHTLTKRRHKMYGRKPVPVCSANKCRKRLGDRQAAAATWSSVIDADRWLLMYATARRMRPSNRKEI